jgi:dihydroceramidase
MQEEQHQVGPRRSRTADEELISKSEDRRDAKILAAMWTMIACGMFMFLAGFVIWSLDNRYCSTLRRWRRSVGLPWGILLEGHGWW